MDDNVRELVDVHADFYCIALDTAPDWSDRKAVIRTVYFKSTRYSAYSGNLQTEWDIDRANRYKTPQGAHTGIARLLAHGNIKPGRKPRVIHYTRTVTSRWETIPASQLQETPTDAP